MRNFLDGDDESFLCECGGWEYGLCLVEKGLEVGVLGGVVPDEELLGLCELCDLRGLRSCAVVGLLSALEVVATEGGLMIEEVAALDLGYDGGVVAGVGAVSKAAGRRWVVGEEGIRCYAPVAVVIVVSCL